MVLSCVISGTYNLVQHTVIRKPLAAFTLTLNAQLRTGALCRGKAPKQFYYFP